jgi:hypothetical protein
VEGFFYLEECYDAIVVWGDATARWWDTGWHWAPATARIRLVSQRICDTPPARAAEDVVRLSQMIYSLPSYPPPSLEEVKEFIELILPYYVSESVTSADKLKRPAEVYTFDWQDVYPHQVEHYWRVGGYVYYGGNNIYINARYLREDSGIWHTLIHEIVHIQGQYNETATELHSMEIGLAYWLETHDDRLLKSSLLRLRRWAYRYLEHRVEYGEIGRGDTTCRSCGWLYERVNHLLAWLRKEAGERALTRAKLSFSAHDRLALYRADRLFPASVRVRLTYYIMPYYYLRGARKDEFSLSSSSSRFPDAEERAYRPYYYYPKVTVDDAREFLNLYLGGDE